MDPVKPSYRDVLALAVPIMLSNLSTPLLGLVDTAALGRSPDAALIAAVALGSVIFTFVFWGFGFLRMGTSGLVAQADGAQQHGLVRLTLLRTLLLAAGLGVVLVLLQRPIAFFTFSFIQGAERAHQLARDYFDIRIWAAPATLVNYGIAGYLVGLGRTRQVLLLQLVLNGCNIALDALLVLSFDMGVSGVAWGTLTAEHVALAMGLWLVRLERPIAGRSGVQRVNSGLVARLEPVVVKGKELFEWAALRRLLRVNTDLMLRTLSLIAVFVFFTLQGARFGETTLAANAVLMQLVTLSAFFLDGIAHATERLVGYAHGARRADSFATAIRRSTVCAVVVAATLSLVLSVGGATAINLLSTAPLVREEALRYLPWAVWGPLAGVWAFQLDGIYIGATRAAEMRNAMMLSLLVFLAGWWGLRGWGNDGLWAALFVHYAARTLSLAMYYPAIARSVDSP